MKCFIVIFNFRVCFKIADFCEGSIFGSNFFLDEPLFHFKWKITMGNYKPLQGKLHNDIGYLLNSKSVVEEEISVLSALQPVIFIFWKYKFSAISFARQLPWEIMQFWELSHQKWNHLNNLNWLIFCKKKKLAQINNQKLPIV